MFDQISSPKWNIVCVISIPSLATDYLEDFSREPDLFSDRVGELRFLCKMRPLTLLTYYITYPLRFVKNVHFM